MEGMVEWGRTHHPHTTEIVGENLFPALEVQFGRFY